MRNVNVKLFRSDEKRFDCGGEEGLLLVDVIGSGRLTFIPI